MMTDRKFQRYKNCLQQHPYEHFLAKAISRNASWRLIIKIDSFQTKKRGIYWMRMLKTIISLSPFITFYYDKEGERRKREKFVKRKDMSRQRQHAETSMVRNIFYTIYMAMSTIKLKG